MNTQKKHTPEPTDSAIQNIIEGGEETLKLIYNNYRSEFLSWATRHYRIPEAAAADVFQDAIIVFYKNVLKGKITHLESSVKSYLYGICKNMFKNYNIKSKKTVLVEDMNDQILKNMDWAVSYNMELSDKQEKIKEAMERLSAVCLKIIDLFYYKRFSMEAIKENMGYKSEEVARTTKKKCMKKLKIMVTDNLER